MLRLASRSRCSRASTAARRRKIKLSQNSTCAKKDRKSTRLNSSHGYISYAVFCLKKKNHVRERNTRVRRENDAAPVRDSACLAVLIRAAQVNDVGVPGRCGDEVVAAALRRAVIT